MEITPKFENFIPGTKDEVCMDDEARSQRQKVLRTAGYNSFFFGANQVLTAVAGVMITFGMTMVGVAAKEILGAPETTMSFTAITMNAAGFIGVSTLGVAAGVVALAVGAHQISSRVAHSVSYDQSEINAQHTAKYMAKELRKELESMQMQQAEKTQAPVQVAFANDPPASGKLWSEIIAERQAANQNIQR